MSFQNVNLYSGAIKVRLTCKMLLFAYLQDTISEYVLIYPLLLIPSTQSFRGLNVTELLKLGARLE